MEQARPGGKVNRRRFLKTAAGTTAGAALAAWSLKHPAPARAAVRSDRARAAEPNPKRGGVLKWAGPAEVAHFDVHQGTFRFVLGQMYNNLVRFNPADGLKTIIPDLAESWKISPDGKTYTFRVRDGVKFHDGTPFSSADVVATFSRIIFPPAGMASLYKDQFAAVDKVEAVDRLTVKFTLKEPRPYFLELFTPSSMIIYSKKALDENNQDLRKVIAPGTGAFMFKERKVA
ncbi:MAG TPA: ABC transporter substrate-binding protein, partial [Vicinamibacteria bacterium]